MERGGSSAGVAALGEAVAVEVAGAVPAVVVAAALAAFSGRGSGY